MKREVNMRIESNKKDASKNYTQKSQSSEERIITDPFGSWTGTNVDNCYEKPIQDVDDL